MNPLPDAPGVAGEAAARASHTPAGGAVSWAVYLGTSWTWCIGMFLPVLLVREMGTLGWIVFAIPNVIGAAAMGWVLQTADASERLVREHRPACIAFSAITVAFHVFFLGWWIGARMLGIDWMLGGAAIAAAVIALLTQRRGWAHAAAWGALAISLAAIAVAFFAQQPPAAMSATRPVAALWLAPACILGFALCPYLDLTFHRARRSLDPMPARRAFSLGFGGVFFAMILFSLWYAPALDRVFDAPALLPRVLLAALGAHIIVQLALTVGLHVQEVRAEGGYWGILIGAAGMGLIAALVAWPRWQWFGLDGGEIFYRLFLGFYGLIFPAYVWICMAPWRQESQRLRLLAAGLAVLLAGPMFFAGFILGHYGWLIGGVAIILAMPALIRRLGRRGTSPAA